VFNTPLNRELASLERARAMARSGLRLGGRDRRRLLRHRLHVIAAGEATQRLGRHSKRDPDWSMLKKLHTAGRDAAETWLSGAGVAPRQHG